MTSLLLKHLCVPNMSNSLILYFYALGFPSGSAVKNSACNAGDAAGATDSIPGSGRSPGEENGNPLQYSCLGNPMDRGLPGGLQSMGSQRVRHDLATKPISMHTVSLNALPLNILPSLLSQGFFCSSSGPSISLAFEKSFLGILFRVFLQNLLIYLLWCCLEITSLYIISLQDNDFPICSITMAHFPLYPRT